MILPALALVVALGVAAAQVGVVQLRLADAASDAARLIGRGESDRAAARIAAAQPGASMSVDRDGLIVCVTASATPSLGGGFDGVPRIAATGCALDDTAPGDTSRPG